jgi:hypothetical protein
VQYKLNDIIRKHALRAAINHLQCTCEQCWWLTFTFSENVTERGYAEDRFRRLKRRLLKHWPGTRAVGVWARQFRGAWHMHMVAEFPGVTDLDLEGDIYNGSGGSESWRWLRSAAVDLKWGQQMKFRRVGNTYLDGAKLANYLGNYCTDKNGLDPVKDKNVRRLIYIGQHVRIFDFRWKSTFKRIVALGRSEHRAEMSGMKAEEEHRAIYTYKKNLFESWGERHRRLLPYWFALGWASMSQQEQQAALTEDRFTRDYLVEGKISYL